jgi:hypothetical protein
MKHINLSAYDSYEVFTDPELENNYRESKIKSCQKHINLIKSQFNDKIDILELGSGNSKFLIGLQQQNLINNAWGIEISKSRSNFAAKWISDLCIENITNINDDIINFNYDLVGEIDVCICVDLCFQFLEPIERGSDFSVLEKVFSKLRTGGKIILELDYCGYIISNLPYTEKIWEEFEETDPWKYSLWDCSLDNETKILNWNKTFISKNNDYESTSIFLKIYDKNDIEFLLNKIGFKNIMVYKDWEYTPFDKQFGEFIIIAEK